MATLTDDTPISTLSLSDGDTIELAGHNLIVDKIMCGSSDPNDTNITLTITNSGGDCNLEFKDRSGIRLSGSFGMNNTSYALPRSVHPYVNTQHPLPVSDPGNAIDGDAYRTHLPYNARCEIQLIGNVCLGGGAAYLPTQTRSGAFWAKVLSSSDSTHLTFDRDFPLHPGDAVFCATYYDKNTTLYTVESYDDVTHTASFSATLPSRSAGDMWILFAGGVLIRKSGGGYNVSYIDRDISGGTILVDGPNSTNCFGSNVLVLADRFLGHITTLSYTNTDYTALGLFHGKIGQLGCMQPFPSSYYGFLSIGELACQRFFRQDINPTINGELKIDSGFCCGTNGYPASNQCYSISGGKVVLKDFVANLCSFSASGNAEVRFENSTINGVGFADTSIVSGGVVTRSDGGYYYVPATAFDVAWRYTDRTVPAGATLRLRCEWMREGSSATRASVAIADTATWWPQLWPLGSDALASVEFSVDGSQLLSWRNTGTESVQVRVWECVTGTVGGGYLKVEEVKGGAL